MGHTDGWEGGAPLTTMLGNRLKLEVSQENQDIQSPYLNSFLFFKNFYKIVFILNRVIASKRFKFGRMNLKRIIPQILHLLFLIYTIFVQLLSLVRFFPTPWTAARQASLSFTISQSLLKLMPIELVMPSNYLICQPLLLQLSISPSIRVFSNGSALHIRWPKYQSFSTSPSNECSGLISFRINWFGLLAVQRALKSLLQHN